MKKCFFMFIQIALVCFIVTADAKEVNATMKLTSPSFETQKEIPKKYTCDGEEVSPALAWSNVPEGR